MNRINIDYQTNHLTSQSNYLFSHKVIIVTIQSNRFRAFLSVYAIDNNDINTSEQFTSSLISWTDSLLQTSIYKSVKSSLRPLHVETTHSIHSHYYYLNMCITNTTWVYPVLSALFTWQFQFNTSESCMYYLKTSTFRFEHST